MKKVFRIFLSSTAEDLRSYRQVVADTVERLNSYPIRMETMGAGPRAPLEECRRQAAEADALIAVAAHRYGWVPPGQEKSITWLEVEAAEAAGRPIFAYLIDPAFPWPHGKEQDALLEASPEDLRSLHLRVQGLKLFKEKLSRWLCATFTTADDLGRKIATDLGNWLRERESPSESDPEAESTRRPPEVGSPPFPAFKTTIGQRFFGRTRILKDVESALCALTASDDARMHLIWLHGFGGMGKSWLIRRAYMLAEEQIPGAKTALIDWADGFWRAPLVDRTPALPGELFTVIATRLAQLYGSGGLNAFWEAQERVRQAAATHRELKQQFMAELARVTEEGKVALGLRETLQRLGFWQSSSSGLRAAVDGLLREPAELDAAFETWVAITRVDGAFEPAAIAPNRVLADSLRRCIADLCASAPLFLLLDTCELLSEELDRWLRILLTGLLDGRTALLVLVGSRLRLDVGIAPGQRLGWLQSVDESRRRLISFEALDVHFTVEEIAQALRRTSLPPFAVDEAAVALHRFTRGVPLAVGTLLDLHSQGAPVLRELSGEEAPPVADLARSDTARMVIEEVSNRLLLHLRREPVRNAAFEDILLLSLLRRTSSAILSRMWETGDVRGRLRNLGRRYSLVGDGDLHATVREYLRRRWRDDPPAELPALASRLVQVVESLKPGELVSTAGGEWLLDRLNAAGWADPARVMPLAARSLAVALAAGPGIDGLILLALEFPAAGLPDESPRHELRKLAGDEQRSLPWGSDPALSWLEQQRAERPMDWDPEERGCLDLLAGLAAAHRGRHQDAIVHLEAAWSGFGAARIPRAGQVAFSYFVSACAIAESEEEVDWKLAETAFGRCLELGYCVAESWARLGDLFARWDRPGDAAPAYETAIAHDPRLDTPRYGLASLLERTGRLREAAGVWSDLGRLLRKVHDCRAEAELAFRNAVDLDPARGDAWTQLGMILERTWLPEARRAYSRAMEQGSAEACFRLGLLHEDERDFEKVRELFRLAVERDPNLLAAWLALGRLEIDVFHDRKGAHETFRRVLQRDERNMAAWVYFGRTSEPGADEEAFRKALEIDPGSPAAWLDLGNALLRQPDPLPQAVAAFREGTQRLPDDVYLWLRCGTALSRSGFPAEAERAYRRALGLRALWPGLWILLADLLQFHLGRPEEADEAYLDALELEPTNATARRGLANLHVGLGRLAQAEREHREILNLDPRDPLPAIGLGNILLLQDDLAGAEEAYRMAISRRSDSAPAWFGLAVCMHRGERAPVEVQRAYERAANLAPDSAGVWGALGHFLEEQGDIEGAEASFRRAVAVSPASAHLWSRLARLCRARPGRSETAEELLRRAVEEKPGAAWYHEELADALRASGKLAEAASTYRIAIELAPGEMVHRLRLAELLWEDLRRPDLSGRVLEELQESAS